METLAMLRAARSDPMNRIIAKALVLLVTAAVLLIASNARADEPVTLRWTHPTPESVDFYKIHIGTEPGKHPREELANPEEADGVFADIIYVEEGVTWYVAIVAHGPVLQDDGTTILIEESEHSNERSFYIAVGRDPLAPPVFLDLSGPRVIEVIVDVDVTVTLE